MTSKASSPPANPPTSRAPRAVQIPAVLAGTIGLAAMVWATDGIATGAGRTYSYLVPSARHAFPQWMRGPLADISSQLGAHRFVVLLAIMSVAYVVVLVVAPQLPARLGLAVIALLVAMLAVAPPLLSTDVFNYVAYAGLGVDGVNPYAYGTVEFVHDPS